MSMGSSLNIYTDTGFQLNGDTVFPDGYLFDPASYQRLIIEFFLIVRLMNQLYKNFIIHRQLKRRFCHAYSADNEAPHLLDSNCLTNGVLFKRDDNGAFICNVIQTTLTYAISTEHEAVS